MKTLLIGMNAKYIHTNLAIRLLKTNCDYPVDIKEFTIKDDYQVIIDYVLRNHYELLGISCYIWNIEFVKELLKKIKIVNSSLLIVLGGPEVTYNAHYYIDNYLVDFVICNEGEVAFNALLKALINKLPLDNISNLVTKTYQNEIKEVDIKNLKSPHYLDNDFSNRIIYIETSRGCPYHCSYCMASLEKKVRFFDLENVKKDILYLMEKGAKTFKFLDRTFNTDLKRALDLFSFIIEKHYPNTSFQFEITGDLLSSEIIDYLNNQAPHNLFRFEIGIQSTNPLTNKLVYRHQNQEKLFNNIRKIQTGKIIDLHLDLIAGLPKEDITSFAKTFNDVLSLRPLELQLGFLKLLKGTKLYDEAPLYQYKFLDKAPYEIIENDSLSRSDIKALESVENVLEKYYNSSFMVKTINYILDYESSAFNFFLSFGKAYEEKYSWLNYNLDDLFVRLYDYLQSLNYPNLDYILFLMKFDYLSHFKVRPKIWWPKLDKKIKNEIIKKINYPQEILYKYSLIEIYQNQYLIAIYKDNNLQISIITI